MSYNTLKQQKKYDKAKKLQTGTEMIIIIHGIEPNKRIYVTKQHCKNRSDLFLGGTDDTVTDDTSPAL